MKVVSYSLWGDNPKYTIGAIRNAELVKSLYPGWKARFYTGSSVPKEITNELRLKEADVVEMQESGDWLSLIHI